MSNLFLYRFRYLGMQGKWFSIRAPTWNTEVRGPMAAHYFENQVFEWLYSNTDSNFHIANGNAKGYPEVPALSNGNSICVLFESMSDLLKFSAVFPVRNMEDLATVFC